MVGFFILKKSTNFISLNKEETYLSSENLTDDQIGSVNISPWTIGPGKTGWTNTYKVTAFNDGVLFLVVKVIIMIIKYLIQKQTKYYIQDFLMVKM